MRCRSSSEIGVSGGRTSAPDFDEVVPRSELARSAARADFLMLLVPYSKETHHLVNREVLAAMMPFSPWSTSSVAALSGSATTMLGVPHEAASTTTIP